MGFSSQTTAGLTQSLWAGPAEAPLWLMVEVGYFGGKSLADPSLPHHNHKTYPKEPFIHQLRGGYCVSSAGPGERGGLCPEGAHGRGGGPDLDIS